MAVAVAPGSDAAIETLNAVIQRISAERPEYSDRGIALLVLEALEESPSEVLLSLLPAVTQYTNTIRRRPSLALEHKMSESFRPSAALAQRKAKATEWRSVLSDYANEYVAIPGCTDRVRAGIVTLDEWKARVAALQRGIDRDQGTVAFLEAMLGELVKAKARTVDQYLAR
jgi:hypothetical protein